MHLAVDLRKRIFNIDDARSFEKMALEVFQFQAEHNEVYKQYIKGLNISLEKIKTIHQIPFLPIQLFKTHQIIIHGMNVQRIFKSSGTGDSGLSKHYIADVALYEESFKKGFEYFLGDISSYCILALLPSYMERGDSSLVYMVNDLIEKSSSADSAFYLNNKDELATKLVELDRQNKKTLLIGVTYALLDFVEKYPSDLKNTMVMETGGMKGKRKEMVRDEVHKILCKGFGVKKIYSEYGMTELLSQAYSKGNGLFFCPPWMKIMVRDVEDPMFYLDNEKTGGINIIDLANVYSCSFIASQDLGKTHAGDSFEILGRFDNSDIRGCNLLAE